MQYIDPSGRLMTCGSFHALATVERDNDSWVVVMNGAGKGFCSGLDLTDVGLPPNIEGLPMSRIAIRAMETMSDLVPLLRSMPQPVIAKIHGIATAAGCQLTSMCDLAVAADDSRFALPGVNIGLFCSTPAVGVARNIGRKRAMEMLLTGELVDARTALEWGLINRAVPAARLDAVERDLEGQGLRLKVWDCYRPLSVQKKLPQLKQYLD